MRNVRNEEEQRDGHDERYVAHGVVLQERPDYTAGNVWPPCYAWRRKRPRRCGQIILVALGVFTRSDLSSERRKRYRQTGLRRLYGAKATCSRRSVGRDHRDGDDSRDGVRPGRQGDFAGG